MPPPPPPADPPSPRHRFPTRRLLVCFLLAIFTSLIFVAVAACIRATSPQIFTSRILTGSDPLPDWLFSPPPGWPPSADRQSISKTFGYAHRIATTYGPARPAPPNSPQAQHMQEQITIGWPIPFLRHRADGTSPVWSARNIGLFTLSDQRDAVIFNPSAVTGKSTGAIAIIPLTPWWPGLVANFALFSILWASILILPAELHHRSRSARGLCLKCGYDLRGLTSCPECGHAIKPQAPIHA